MSAELVQDQKNWSMFINMIPYFKSIRHFVKFKKYIPVEYYYTNMHSEYHDVDWKIKYAHRFDKHLKNV